MRGRRSRLGQQRRAYHRCNQSGQGNFPALRHSRLGGLRALRTHIVTSQTQVSRNVIVPPSNLSGDGGASSPSSAEAGTVMIRQRTTPEAVPGTMRNAEDRTRSSEYPEGKVGIAGFLRQLVSKAAFRQKALVKEIAGNSAPRRRSTGHSRPYPECVRSGHLERQNRDWISDTRTGKERRRNSPDCWTVEALRAIMPWLTVVVMPQSPGERLFAAAVHPSYHTCLFGSLCRYRRSTPR